MIQPGRAERVAELVKSALEREPEERATFLEEACAGDPELRAEIDSLLHFHEQASGFIETPALHLAAEALAREQPLEAEQAIAGYKILSKIGAGGMGDVYLAQDTELRRKVALKLVRPGMNTEDIVARFRHEEQILASLNHPNIAQLYGGGATAEGSPFFVMEHVEGAPIELFCRRQSLDTTARLQLFRKVCAAVHYAHQHLVIHRDLKPSNILVTASGEPKLLDFGIAKLLDAHELSAGAAPTLLGVMTPDYASPEQVRGDAITTASDTYSLGVILYELLTGCRPYRSKSRRPDEIARAITEEIPARPSTAVSDDLKSEISNLKFLKGDLDNIVLMALRKEPPRRYSSVAQFSEDLRRHLEGLPVVAHKDTARYRTAKFVKRHKLGVLATVLVIAAALAGMGATLREKRRAERRFHQVRQLSNALLFEIAPRIERLEGSTDARQSVLTQSLKYLDSLAEESGDDRALQSELAAAYEKVGDLQGNPTNPNLIALAEALVSYEKAGAIRRKLLEQNSRDPEERRLLANNYRIQGDIRWQTNEPAASLKNSEAASSLYTELLAAAPASMELRLALARTHHDIGMNFSTNGKKADSIAYFQKTIDAAEELRRQAPEAVEVLTLLANGHKQMGNALSWERKQAQGEAEMAQAIALYAALLAAHPGDSSLRTGLYQTYMMTSSVYEEVNDGLANEYAFKALEIIARTVERDPANQRAKQQLAKAYSRAGVTLANLGRSAESILYLEKAVAILQTIAQNETKNRRFRHDLATALTRLGDARRKERDFQGALAEVGKASAILSELAAGDPADNASLRNLASAHDSLARTQEALALQASGEEQRSHRQIARRHYLGALEILRQLEARNALSKFDRKSLEELQSAVQKYE